MKAKTKSSNSHNKSKKITNQRNPGQRLGQQNPQRKVDRAERAPVALGNKTYQSKPRYRSMGENLCVIHSEYIGDIAGSTEPFAVSKTLAINPGLSESFPWLNQIAGRYESYKFLKLNYRFMTERPTTESGFVAIVPDYDPTDPPPASKSNAFQYESTAKCAPWENLLQASTPRNLSKRQTYAVRQSAVTATENVGLYDTGNLFICVGGNSGTVNLGELWCDYELCLMTPQIDSNVGPTFDSSKVLGVSAMTPARPFGSAASITNSRNPIFNYDGATGDLTFVKDFEGLFSLVATGTGLEASDFVGGTATISNFFDLANSTGTNFSSEVLVKALAGQTLNYGIVADTIATSKLFASAYAYSLSS